MNDETEKESVCREHCGLLVTATPFVPCRYYQGKEKECPHYVEGG